nr:T9SS type A sorting domain-containing protein [Bacteroidota bacterium]
AISDLACYPNPFSQTTTITYSINRNTVVELSVLDLLGKKIGVVDTGNKTKGNHISKWGAENIAPGIYFLQLKENNNVSTKKIIISR